MQFKVNFTSPILRPMLQQQHKVLLLGSCFTEHMSKRMLQCKMQVLQNPNGILFNPISVANCLQNIIENKTYTEADLFYHQEAWHSWHIHSNYSNANKQLALQNINSAIQEAHNFIQNTDWVIITLGSAFAYWHNSLQIFVANNHRVNLNEFTKTLLDVTQITSSLQQQIDALKKINSNVQILFTISPVRHLRDGLIDNNRSKARLIEATHALCNSNNNVQYFGAYEIVIDELRDYRFYDIDFAHPNFMATEYVWQRFLVSGIDPTHHELITNLTEISTAQKHIPSNPTSQAHKEFLANYLQKCLTITAQHKHINLADAIQYFSGNST